MNSDNSISTSLTLIRQRQLGKLTALHGIDAVHQRHPYLSTRLLQHLRDTYMRRLGQYQQKHDGPGLRFLTAADRAQVHEAIHRTLISLQRSGSIGPIDARNLTRRYVTLLTTQEYETIDNNA